MPAKSVEQWIEYWARDKAEAYCEPREVQFEVGRKVDVLLVLLGVLLGVELAVWQPARFTFALGGFEPVKLQSDLSQRQRLSGTSTTCPKKCKTATYPPFFDAQVPAPTALTMPNIKTTKSAVESANVVRLSPNIVRGRLAVGSLYVPVPKPAPPASGSATINVGSWLAT